ncbi:MAG: PilZ domain-containing protein [Candidatus Hydrogenedentota bacterium]
MFFRGGGSILRKERRVYLRYEIELPVDIEMDEGNVSIKTVSKNISGGGIFVEVPVRPELFSQAILKIDFSNIGGGVKVIPAVVVHTLSKESVNEQRSEVGLVFDTNDNELRMEIDNCLRKAYPFERIKNKLKFFIKSLL